MIWLFYWVSCFKFYKYGIRYVSIAISLCEYNAAKILIKTSFTQGKEIAKLKCFQHLKKNLKVMSSSYLACSIKIFIHSLNFYIGPIKKRILHFVYKTLF